MPGQEKRASNASPSGPDNVDQEKGTGQDFYPSTPTEKDIRAEHDLTDLSRVTMMTIRAKKANADAFAAGKISEEQFAKEAEVGAYLGPVPQDRATEGGTRWMMR